MHSSHGHRRDQRRSAHIRARSTQRGRGMVQPPARARAWPDEGVSATLKEVMTENLFDLTGKVAVVTASIRGLVHHLARALAQAGADLLMTTSRMPDLNNLHARTVSCEA